MIYIAKTNYDLYAYYDYDENIGGYFFSDEFDDFVSNKNFVLVDTQLPVKKVERFLVNYAIENELEQKNKGRETRPVCRNK